MIYVFYFIHIVTCFFLILVVLLQQGKGADLSVFGGGATQSAFGARGATQLIHKLTVASFVMFVLTTVGISVLQSRGGGGSVMERSVMEEADDTTEEPAATTEEPAAAPAEAAPPEGPETLTFQEPEEGASGEAPEEPPSEASEEPQGQ